ncbi:hypothetical protein A4G20_08035 [Pasteurellaceae bacterium RH1A]|nr:hypothetical protein A4G20_08035 [Pasteurellaceae bacterium RH1A]
MTANKLEFIRKTRPKLKAGNVFYYRINNKVYFGLVFITKAEYDYVGIAFIVVLPNYAAQQPSDFSPETLIETIQKGDLLAPPTNINQRAWTMGYFNVIDHIDLSSIPILDTYRMNHSGFLYDRWGKMLFDLRYDVHTPDIPNILFLGDMGIYAHEGIEYLIQLGLGLDYDAREKPYDFYESYPKNFSEEDLPYWYFNSIGKPLVKP